MPFIINCAAAHTSLFYKTLYKKYKGNIIMPTDK